MMRKDKLKTLAVNRDGIALAVVVIIFAIVSILATSVLAMTMSEVSQTANNEKNNQSYYLADSAARVAMEVVKERIVEYQNRYATVIDIEYPSLTDAADVVDIIDELYLEFIPDGDGKTKSMTISFDGNNYDVEIIRYNALDGYGFPVGDDGSFDLYIEATSLTPRAASSMIRLATFDQDKFILYENSTSISTGDGIRATGKITGHHGGGNPTRVHGGNVNAGDDLINEITVDSMFELNEYQDISAEIIVPEMVWKDVDPGIDEDGEINIPLKGSNFIGNYIVNSDSGYYTCALPKRAFTVDLTYGSVVMIFESMNYDNSSGFPCFTVMNNDPTTVDKNSFYLFIMEKSSYAPPAVPDPTDVSNLTVRDYSAAFIENDFNNHAMFINDATLGDRIRSYFIAYNDGAQKFIIDNNPDIFEPSNPTKLNGIPSNFVIPHDDPIIQNATSAPYKQYYDTFDAFGNKGTVYAHVIMPLCNITLGNSVQLYGSIQVGSIVSGHGDIYYSAIMSERLNHIYEIGAGGGTPSYIEVGGVNLIIPDNLNNPKWVRR